MKDYLQDSTHTYYKPYTANDGYETDIPFSESETDDSDSDLLGETSVIVLTVR